MEKDMIKACDHVPYIAHEADMARIERTNKRLFIALILSIVLMFATNAFWVYEWMQYDYVEESTDIDVDAGSGTANYIGNDGDIDNGTYQSTPDGEAPNAQVEQGNP